MGPALGTSAAFDTTSVFPNNMPGKGGTCQGSSLCELNPGVLLKSTSRKQSHEKSFSHCFLFVLSGPKMEMLPCSEMPAACLLTALAPALQGARWWCCIAGSSGRRGGGTV